MVVQVPDLRSSPKLVTHYTCKVSTALHQTFAINKLSIKEAKYEKFTPQQVADKSPHLKPDQKFSLINLLQQFPHLFSGRLGKHKKAKFTLLLQNHSVPPVFCKPYPVAQIHREVFTKELQHLIQEDVLQQIERSEWTLPIFIILKKDGRVRWVSDFHMLNSSLNRSRYFLPSISEIM